MLISLKKKKEVIYFILCFTFKNRFGSILAVSPDCSTLITTSNGSDIGILN